MQADSALAQDAWAEGQGGDVVCAIPQLYKKKDPKELSKRVSTLQLSDST